MKPMRPSSPLVGLMLFVSLAGAKFYSPPQYTNYKAGHAQHHDPGNPTSRHKNHCAYVVEKMVSFTMQGGAAPYVKAEYNNCSWGKKCPALMYRLMYKPVFKVAHKAVTELEWRCCPGFSGYGCMESAYHHPMRMMPPFKGPPFKGPQFKGPAHKGPMLKGPMFKGPPMKSNPWSQPKGPPPGGVQPFPVPHFGPPMGPSYPESSFEGYPSGPEAMPDQQGPHHTQHGPEEGHEPEPEVELEHGLGHEDQHGQTPEQHVSVETAPTHEDVDAEGQGLAGEADERLDQMEDHIRRLGQSLEILRGTVSGLEDGLRASLREDANRMLSALLSAGPGPASAPAPDSGHLTVGFGDIPGGDPELEGLDGRHVLPPVADLSGKLEELRVDLLAQTAELLELRTTVMTHDGALKTLSGDTPGAAAVPPAGDDSRKAAEILVDVRLGGVRTEVLDGFERRVAGAEDRCEEKAGEVRRQCQRELGAGQQQMQQTLEDSTIGWQRELVHLRTKVHGLESAESCCGRTPGLRDRMKQLEVSVAGLNQSQAQLRVELGGHRDHIEGLLEGRLGYVESRLNLTDAATLQGGLAGRGSGRVAVAGDVEQRLEAKLEGQLKALEGRLLIAVEELGNATAPALLEGHAVPTLETELESLRRRLETDVDRVQRHLSSLELRCSSSGSSTSTSVVQGDASVSTDSDPDKEAVFQGLLGLQADRLDSLNATLETLLTQLALRERQEAAAAAAAAGGSSVQGELTFLKFNIRSVNRTLKLLQGSVGTVVDQVDRANSTWHEREERLARQMKGMVQLVGRQASMLGTGDRRLTRLKGELQEMRRRLAGELQGCHSTALGVRKEVTEVEGRVASVEDQCKGLNHVAEDLERIREELERQSEEGLFAQLRGTVLSHSQQLSDLRGEVRNCSAKADSEPQTATPAQTRGDTFTLI